MINVRGNIDARAGTDFHGRLVVHHLFSFTRYDINDLLRSGMIMSFVQPFPAASSTIPKLKRTAPVTVGSLGESGFFPIEFETINVLSGSNDAGSKFMHSSRG